MEDKIVYLNTSLGKASPPNTTSNEPAETNVSRSGAFLADPSKYAVAVFRLKFLYEQPIWIPDLDLSVGDGVTTPYSVSLRAEIGGSDYIGRAFLRLTKKPSEIVPYTERQPTNGYTYVWTIYEVAQMVNEALAEAYAQLVAFAIGLDPAAAPFVSYVPGTVDVLRFNAFPLSLWETKDIGFGGDRAEVYVNDAFEFFLTGWEYDTRTRLGAPPDPNGLDHRLLIWNDGLNYEGGGGGGGGGGPRPGISPANPSNASIFLVQRYASPYPGIERVTLTTTLPIVAEADGSTGAARDRVLTDFAPDSTQAGRYLQFFNASFGDARWHSMTGKDPIASFSLALNARQWNGVVTPLKVFWPGNEPSVKLAFAPLDWLRFPRRSTG